jgi:transcriptional regulator with GAF, ATPase, and Fis domain
MGRLAREVREITRLSRDAENSICVSSGTAEMRAAWFLLTAVGALPAKLLQVGSPADPLFGAANVKEVRLDIGDWAGLREIVSPQPPSPDVARDMALNDAHAVEAIAGRISDLMDQLPEPAVGEGQAAARFASPRRPPEPGLERGLEEALQELGMYTFSAALRAAAESAAIAAESDAPVLLLGETGTGKELFSKLIHRMSSRRSREMVAVNCSGIPRELAESFLFGHVRGAFTGANANQQGKFERANGSTLFLDELAELTPEVQAKLLRVIEDGMVEPLGSNTRRRVDVRIVAATNHNLDQAVEEGRFRTDLYYRLKVFPIRLPSLRDRRGEIPHLAAALLKQINQRYQRQRQLSKEALRRLEQHDWPGNVRELRGVLERSVLYSREAILEAEDILIETPASTGNFKGLPEPRPGFSLEDFLRQVKKELIDRALARSAGNQSAAADLLGVSRQAINNYVRNQTVNVD